MNKNLKEQDMMKNFNKMKTDKKIIDTKVSTKKTKSKPKKTK